MWQKIKCPLVDKDHVMGCTRDIEETLISFAPESFNNLLNELSYEAMWQSASTQLSIGLSVVIVSPLSRHSRFDRLLEVASRANAQVVVIECKPENMGEWRRRLEKRGEEDETSWHKVRTWAEMERLLEEYGGCWRLFRVFDMKIRCPYHWTKGTKKPFNLASTLSSENRSGSFCFYT